MSSDDEKVAEAMDMIEKSIAKARGYYAAWEYGRLVYELGVVAVRIGEILRNVAEDFV